MTDQEKKFQEILSKLPIDYGEGFTTASVLQAMQAAFDMGKQEGQEQQKWQLCPKCNGQGIVSKPPHIAGDVNQWVSSSSQFQCDVCSGAKILPAPPKTEKI